MNSGDFCKKVVTIPQYKGTCWFNAILMALLYSQSSRKILLYDDNLKQRKDKLSLVLKEILHHHYINHKDVAKYFNILKPEKILALCNIPFNTYNFMIENGWSSNIFLSKFIEYIGMSCLTLDYINGIFFTGLNEHIDYYVNHNNQIQNIYANLNNPTDVFFIKLAEKMQKINNPDYICINLWNSKELENDSYLHLFNSFLLIPVFFQKLQLNYYRPIYSNLYELKEEITYNGYVYKLDSCILGNYDNIEYGHAICGIKCKNKKYVYNGWIRTTEDRAIGDADYGKDDLLPCELFKYNWDIHSKYNNFCLKPDKCELNIFSNSKKHKLCFSFNKGQRTLIYVKQKKEHDSVDINIITPQEKVENIFVKPEPKIKEKTMKILTNDLDEYNKIIKLYNLKISNIIKKIKIIRNEIKKNKNKL